MSASACRAPRHAHRAAGLRARHDADVHSRDGQDERDREGADHAAPTAAGAGDFEVESGRTPRLAAALAAARAWIPSQRLGSGRTTPAGQSRSSAGQCAEKYARTSSYLRAVKVLEGSWMFSKNRPSQAASRPSVVRLRSLASAKACATSRRWAASSRSMASRYVG